MTKENMGGVTSIEILFRGEIEVAAPSGLLDYIYVKVKEGNQWQPLLAAPGSISITPTSEDTPSGLLETLEGSLRVAHDDISPALIKRLKYEPFIMKYTDAHGVTKVAGTLNYMLKGIADQTPLDVAESFRGYTITITGKGTTPPLPLQILP